MQVSTDIIVFLKLVLRPRDLDISYIWQLQCRYCSPQYWTTTWVHVCAVEHLPHMFSKHCNYCLLDPSKFQAKRNESSLSEQLNSIYIHLQLWRRNIIHSHLVEAKMTSWDKIHAVEIGRFSKVLHMSWCRMEPRRLKRRCIFGRAPW